MTAPQITQGDVEAASAYRDSVHGDVLSEAFARHREASQAELVEALGRVIATYSDIEMGEVDRRLALEDALTLLAKIGGAS